MYEKKIQQVLATIGLDCTDEQAGKIYHFYEILVEKNKSVNLTRITDFDAFLVKHLLDSLSVYLLKDIIKNSISSLYQSNAKILDLGTGAGFPGIPLAVFFPEASYTLLDSLKKRIAFINEAAADLSIKNISPIHARAEELARQKGERETYHLCLSRAVANLSTLAEYALPFVQTGGYFISYKGGDAKEEIHQAKHAIKELGGKLCTAYEFTLPSTKANNLEVDENINRTLVVIQKTRPTMKKYPRQAGMPSKHPL